MEVKKFNQYIKESTTVSEIEIQEFAKEEAEKLISDLYERMAKKFPIDSSDLDKDQKFKQSNVLRELSDLVSEVTIKNISVLNKADKLKDVK